jgi:hypothetical protein
MKTLYLYIVIGLLGCGCKRSAESNSQNQPKSAISNKSESVASNSGSAALRTTGDDQNDVETRMKELFKLKQTRGELSQDELIELRAMLPKLQTAGIFWNTMSGIGWPQVREFKDPMLDALSKMEPPKLGQEVEREFRAYNAANSLRIPEVSRIALEKLPKATVFRFPKTTPPPWSESTKEGLELIQHGAQGILASTVVRWGDEATIASFRELVKSAKPDSQRVYIWALGQSPKFEDFELLMSLRSKVSDPDTTDTLVRALNRSVSQMFLLAKYPELFPKYQNSSTSSSQLISAEKCLARLKELNIIVPLTIFD